MKVLVAMVKVVVMMMTSLNWLDGCDESACCYGDSGNDDDDIP